MRLRHGPRCSFHHILDTAFSIGVWWRTNCRASTIKSASTMKLHHQPWKFPVQRLHLSSPLAHLLNTTMSSLSPTSIPTATSTSHSAMFGPTPAPPRATTPPIPSASFPPRSPTHLYTTIHSPALSGAAATIVLSCFVPQGKESPSSARRRSARLSL